MNPIEMQEEKKLKYLLDTLREVSEREPQAASRGKAHFLEEVNTLRPSGTRQVEYHPNRQGNAFFTLLHSRAPAHLRNSLLAAVLAVAIFLGGFAVTAYAAQDSLPYNTLYPIKTLSEDVLLSVSVSPQIQLDLALKYTDRRLAEMAALQATGEPIPQNLNDRFTSESDLTLTLLEKMDDDDMPQALQQARRRVEAEIQQLTRLMAGRPADPVLMAVKARLQEQAQLIAIGESSPQAFRLHVNHRSRNAPGSAGGQQQGVGPKSTPVPGGNQDGSNPGVTRPTNIPVQNPPGDQNAIKTRQPGEKSGQKP